MHLHVTDLGELAIAVAGCGSRHRRQANAAFACRPGVRNAERDQDGRDERAVAAAASH
ncbi:MAG TPA: hypothetical protein PL143_09800 [Rhodocyclaceae bacterium]|nr:hypothetical protein [Rhodocyclaceae bacterium]